VQGSLAWDPGDIWVAAANPAEMCMDGRDLSPAHTGRMGMCVVRPPRAEDVEEFDNLEFFADFG
jgi:hypothetical protein